MLLLSFRIRYDTTRLPIAARKPSPEVAPTTLVAYKELVNQPTTN